MLQYRKQASYFTGGFYGIYDTGNENAEISLLNAFPYKTIFIPDGVEPPPKSIITSSELQVYVNRFGALKDDFALAAEIGKKIVDAV